MFVARPICLLAKMEVVGRKGSAILWGCEMRCLRICDRGWTAIWVGVGGSLELGGGDGRRRSRQASMAPTDSSHVGSYGVGSWIFRGRSASTPHLYAGHDGWPNVGLRGRVPGDTCVAAGLIW